MSRMLILGAGRFQVSGIRRAVSDGHEVHTADWDLVNPGHAHAFRGHEVSTTDVEAVVRLAQELEVDGVCTFASDAACEAAARVCDVMGLPGIGEETAHILCHKGRFREMQARAGLTHPEFVVLGPRDRPPEGDWLLKPTDSSGSKGVGEDLADARRHSRCGEVIAERKVRGVEVGGDLFLVDGVAVHASVTAKHLDGFMVTGHSLPPVVSREGSRAAVGAVLACALTAGCHQGPVNFDVMLDEGRATVLEMSPRTGGNGIPGIITRATGFDGERATIAAAMGQRAPKDAPVINKGCGSVVLPEGADEGAVRALPEVFEVLTSSLGGYALFDLPNGRDWAAGAARIQDVAGV